MLSAASFPKYWVSDVGVERAGVSRWARRIASKDGLWKALYFERWNDPRSHAREREAEHLGWKKIYENKDTAGRRSDQHEEAMRSAQDEEDEECQEAFRAMQAAQRSKALQKKCTGLERETHRSAIDVIQDAILEFKSHCKFPYPEDASKYLASRGGDSSGGGGGQGGPGGHGGLWGNSKSKEHLLEGESAAGDTPASSEAPSTCPSPAASMSRTSSRCSSSATSMAGGDILSPSGAGGAGVSASSTGTARGAGVDSMFGRGGFYTSFTAGHLRNYLRSKLNALPRQHQLEVCVCKFTGKVHLCSRDTGARGCELAYPNDDGFFVCPITGIIWETTRHTISGEPDEDEGEGEAADYEGGSKSFCNMVRQGYECEKDPSAEMGWGSWLEDRACQEKEVCRFKFSNGRYQHVYR